MPCVLHSRQDAAVYAETWDELPEDTDERRMFDHGAKVYGSPLMAIAVALRIQSHALPPEGSQAKFLAIAANEIARAVSRGAK
jgi:hypothetical protein